MSFNPISESISSEERLPFWYRQFSKDRTESQQVFDVIFGLIAPILCFACDPVVFKGDFLPEFSLQSYQLFAYSVAAIEVSVLAVWFLFGSRLKPWSKLLGGVLISGSVFSAAIGVAILPLSLMGLVIAIGVFGFIPFLTAFVYLRVGWRALKSEGRTTLASWTLALVIGALFSLGTPALMSLYVSRAVSNSIDTILHGDPQQAQVALTRLRRCRLFLGRTLPP